MTSGETMYLTLVIAVFVIFAAALAFFSSRPGRAPQPAAVAAKPGLAPQAG